MALQKLLSYTEGLEDPDHPLMGPTKKGLYFFGLWQSGPKSNYILYNMLHFSTIVFVFTQFADLYSVKDDLNTVLNNMSLTVLSVICGTKCISLLWNQTAWRQIVYEISELELKQIQENDKTTMRLMRQYTNYTRVITYLFWALVFATNALLIVSPFLKCVSTPFREDVLNGKEPLPQIMFSWFPFDNKKMPGYIFGIFVHIIMGCQGSGVIAMFDMNAVAIMSYLKGQMIILRERCRRIFEANSSMEVLERICLCHGHHNLLVKHHQMLNALLSPTMFFYVLVCSIMICGSVVQFTSEGVTTSQKLWVLQYTAGLICQLFLYCWHSNEVAVESKIVDKGVYESDWWRGDKKLRRLALLLACKLNKTLIFDAGDTTLSVPTFMEIIKRSYSFFTLFSQMQDK